jgi:hypothetical protein
VQEEIEQEVSALNMLGLQRAYEGVAGKATRSIQKRMSAKKKKIRLLMSLWKDLHETSGG